MKRIAHALASARARHEARQRPSGFGFALADRIAYLPPDVWDGLAAQATIFLGRPYLSSLEESSPANLRSRYAVVYRGRTPAALVSAQIVDLSALRLVPKAAKPSDVLKSALANAARKIKETALGRLEAQLLVCGNLLSWGFHGVAFAPGEDPAAIWPGVLEALYRIRRAEKLAGETDLVLVKDLTDAEAPGTAALKAHSYRPLATEPDMVLQLAPAWGSHDGYLESLTSDYRKAARKIFRQIEEAGGTVGSVEPAAHGARLHELYLQVHDNAALRPVTLSPDYIPALARALGDRFKCVALRQGERLLGFVTLVRDRDTAVGYHIGFDREAARNLPVYLRLLHAVVAEAIAWKCRSISLGRTALEPKARLGCKPRPLSLWLRHRVPLLNLAIRGLLRTIPHDEPPERNPFK